MKLKHYYHMYANGHWHEPFTEHREALTESGLLDTLDFIGVGIVGSDVNRAEVKRVLPANFQVVAEAGVGWEQVTHAALAADLIEPAKILYAHTKGAAHHGHNQAVWRREMTAGTVYHWQECISFLDKYDAVGCRWRRNPWRHYSGTFWWATSSYLSNLAPISYVQRFDAEAWIGENSLGGSHVEINPFVPGLDPKVHTFGRTFVGRTTTMGYALGTMPDIGKPRLGDEFVGFSPVIGNQIITYLIMHGARCHLIGNTIVVDSV